MGQLGSTFTISHFISCTLSHCQTVRLSHFHTVWSGLSTVLNSQTISGTAGFDVSQIATTPRAPGSANKRDPISYFPTQQTTFSINKMLINTVNTYSLLADKEGNVPAKGAYHLSKQLSSLNKL